MKKTENLKSVIVLLIATGIAIGLLSSTAVKLASATSLLKQTNSLSSVKLAGDEETSEETTEETTGEATDDTTAKPGSGEVTSPVGGSGDSGSGDSGSGNSGSGNSGSGDSGSGDSGSGDSGSGGGILDTITGLLGGLGGGIELPDLGGLLGGGSEEPEETPEAPVDNTAEYKSVMASYKAVVDMVKLSSKSYTKTTSRSISWNILNDLFIGKAKDITVDDVKYFSDGIESDGKANEDPSFILNNKFACALNVTDDGVIDEAVKSAQKTTLDDGKTKIVIEFNDSSADGFIKDVLPVLTADQVKALFNAGISAGLTDVEVTYTGCSIELVYDAYTGEIVSLTQYIQYNVDASGAKSFSTTITETNVYTF